MAVTNARAQHGTALDSPDTEWLTPIAISKLIGVRPDFVYDMCRANQLRHTRLGGKRRIRIHRDWLRAWMEQHAPSTK